MSIDVNSSREVSWGGAGRRVDLLGPDLYVPSTWDHVYAQDRFLELRPRHRG